MKLVFIGNTAWSMYNFRRPVLQYFIKNGDDVIVISPFDSVYKPYLEDLGCRCYTIDLESKGTNPVSDWKTMLGIRRILKAERPDCCFFYTVKPNIYGSMAAASLHIPYVPVTTGLGYVFLVDNFVSRIAKILYKIAFKKAVRIWFLNKDDVAAFRQEKLADDTKMDVLKGEGIDVSKFEVYNGNKEISFILIARMLWDKGIGEYVEAAKTLKKKYPKVKFKLLGFLGVDNPRAVSKEQMDVWTKEGVVEYLGTTQDVRPYLYESSCVVLPSYYREGIPFCLMEGAAAGKPLITTNSVGCREVVDDGVSGYLCKVKDIEDLRYCMAKIIEMPEEERVQMGLRGREKMRSEFGINRVIEKYEQMLRMIATESK